MMLLFVMYPRPWRIEQDESIDPTKYSGVFTVYASNGLTVINGGTYTGDGDTEVNLDRLQAEELVEIVNGNERFLGRQV